MCMLSACKKVSILWSSHFFSEPELYLTFPESLPPAV